MIQQISFNALTASGLLNSSFIGIKTGKSQIKSYDSNVGLVFRYNHRLPENRATFIAFQDDLVARPIRDV